MINDKERYGAIHSEPYSGSLGASDPILVGLYSVRSILLDNGAKDDASYRYSCLVSQEWRFGRTIQGDFIASISILSAEERNPLCKEDSDRFGASYSRSIPRDTDIRVKNVLSSSRSRRVQQDGGCSGHTHLASKALSSTGGGSSCIRNVGVVGGYIPSDNAECLPFNGRFLRKDKGRILHKPHLRCGRNGLGHSDGIFRFQEVR